MGLPMNATRAGSPDYSFTPASSVTRCDTCSTDGGGCETYHGTNITGPWAGRARGYYGHICSVSVVGVLGSDAAFCSERGCVGSCANSSCSDPNFTGTGIDPNNPCSGTRTVDWYCGDDLEDCIAICQQVQPGGVSSYDDCAIYCGESPEAEPRTSSCVKECIREQSRDGTLTILATRLCEEICSRGPDGLEPEEREGTRSEEYP